MLDVRQIDEKGLPTGRFPKVRQELRVVLDEGAFDRAVARGDAELGREIGGVLVGEVLRDDAGPFLLVDATIDALHAEEKGAELTFTHATWDHIHKEMDAKHNKKKIVGWYHTHPGFGIFLSDRDQFIHKSFFDLPFQIALVYDPKSKEHGVFAWRDGQPARARRYWVGDREHTWDGARTDGASPAPRPRASSGAPPGPVARAGDDAPPRSARGSAPPSRRAEEPAAAEADRGGAMDLKTVAVAAVTALILGGAGGFWWGTREVRATLEQVDVELARARAEAQRGVIREIDAQLVGVLRSTVGNEAVRRPLDQAFADLDEADRILADAPPPGAPELDAGLAKLRAARERVQHLREDRGDAAATLARLEEITRQGAPGPAEMARDLGVVRAGLGALYAELAGEAARAGDARRAERLLSAAASVDPGNRERYEEQQKAPPPADAPGAKPPAKGKP
jgi:proteasome lid subunit RPN8/RPN11